MARNAHASQGFDSGRGCWACQATANTNAATAIEKVSATMCSGNGNHTGLPLKSARFDNR